MGSQSGGGADDGRVAKVLTNKVFLMMVPGHSPLSYNKVQNRNSSPTAFLSHQGGCHLAKTCSWLWDLWLLSLLFRECNCKSVFIREPNSSHFSLPTRELPSWSSHICFITTPWPVTVFKTQLTSKNNLPRCPNWLHQQTFLHLYNSIRDTRDP